MPTPHLSCNRDMLSWQRGEKAVFYFSVKCFNELVLVSSPHFAGVSLAVLESHTLYVHTDNDVKCNLF